MGREWQDVQLAGLYWHQQGLIWPTSHWGDLCERIDAPRAALISHMPWFLVAGLYKIQVVLQLGMSMTDASSCYDKTSGVSTMPLNFGMVAKTSCFALQADASSPALESSTRACVIYRASQKRLARLYLQAAQSALLKEMEFMQSLS